LQTVRLDGVRVVRRVALDPVLYGHNMAVDGCTAYVALQNGMMPSKLAVVDLCRKDGAGVPEPAVVSEAAGSYAAMNGMTVAAGKLYLTYGWATNPFEIRETRDVGKVVGCVPLFSDAGYAACGQSAQGNGALWGGAPVVMGKYAYVPENSDDAGQAVQVVDVSEPARPVKVTGTRWAPAGVTAGRSVQGGALAGIWAPSSGTSPSSTRLYVGTITVPGSEGQAVTIAAYDVGRDAERPVQVGKVVSLGAGYIIENMAVEGTTVVANLWNWKTKDAAIAVVDFADEGAPRVATIAPTKGCVPGAGNFIEMKNGLALFGCSTLGPSLYGIEVVDVRDAARPVLLGLVATELKRVNFLSLQGRWLYAVDVEGRLDVVGGVGNRE
jgi:hypothetical protein